MSPEEFVEVLNEVVVESSIRDIQSNLTRPPGRQPAESSIQMSQWYNALGDGDKLMLLKVIRKSVRSGVFGFLCVLDGVLAVENGEKGEFKLYYEKNGEANLLNEKILLHDLL